MNAKELAVKYYPTFWDMDRIKKLLEAGKLTTDEYKEITGVDYTIKMKEG